MPELEPPLAEAEASGQRKITYEIEKNRGLTPHRLVAGRAGLVGLGNSTDMADARGREHACVVIGSAGGSGLWSLQRLETGCPEGTLEQGYDDVPCIAPQHAAWQAAGFFLPPLHNMGPGIG